MCFPHEKTRPGRADAAPWPRVTWQRQVSFSSSPSDGDGRLSKRRAACLSPRLYRARRRSGYVFSGTGAEKNRGRASRAPPADGAPAAFHKNAVGGEKVRRLSLPSLSSPPTRVGEGMFNRGAGAPCVALGPIHSTAHFSSNSARHKDACECSKPRADCKREFRRFLPAAGLPVLPR